MLLHSGKPDRCSDRQHLTLKPQRTAIPAYSRLAGRDSRYFQAPSNRHVLSSASSHVAATAPVPAPSDSPVIHNATMRQPELSAVWHAVPSPGRPTRTAHMRPQRVPRSRPTHRHTDTQKHTDSQKHTDIQQKTQPPKKSSPPLPSTCRASSIRSIKHAPLPSHGCIHHIHLTPLAPICPTHELAFAKTCAHHPHCKPRMLALSVADAAPPDCPCLMADVRMLAQLHRGQARNHQLPVPLLHHLASMALRSANLRTA